MKASKENARKAIEEADRFWNIVHNLTCVPQAYGMTFVMEFLQAAKKKLPSGNSSKKKGVKK